MTFDPPIPAQSIEAVRLTCKRCGVAVIMPLATTQEVPSKCFNCATPLHANNLQELMRQFKYLQSDLDRPDVAFLAHLEQRQA